MRGKTASLQKFDCQYYVNGFKTCLKIAKDPHSRVFCYMSRNHLFYFFKCNFSLLRSLKYSDG